VPGVWDFADPWFGDATIGHEHLGAFLNITFSLIAGLLFCGYPAKKYQRYSLGLLWACCMFCLVYASSRGAWVGTVCSLAMLFLWFLQQGRIAQLFSYCVYATLGLAVLVYALDLDPIELIGKRIEGLVTVTSGEITDLSAIDRFEVLHLLWNRYLERPLVGWGAGGAGRIAEGQYIRELVEGGIIGGILFMAMLFYCVVIALKHYRRSSDSLIKGSNLGLICGLAGIAGQSLFTELFIVTKVGNPLWVLIAIVQSLGLQEDRTVQ
jgi:O-antigen ligase